MNSCVDNVLSFYLKPLVLKCLSHYNILWILISQCQVSGNCSNFTSMIALHTFARLTPIVIYHKFEFLEFLCHKFNSVREYLAHIVITT